MKSIENFDELDSRHVWSRWYKSNAQIRILLVFIRFLYLFFQFKIEIKIRFPTPLKSHLKYLIFLIIFWSPPTYFRFPESKLNSIFFAQFLFVSGLRKRRLVWNLKHEMSDLFPVKLPCMFTLLHQSILARHESGYSGYQKCLIF